MVQHRGRYADETPAATQPRHQTTRHQGADVGYLRRRAHRPGDVHRTLHRHPRRGAGDLPHLETYAPRAGLRPRKGPRHPGKNLLQERKRLARRFAQTQHRRAAGLLQLQTGNQTSDHRDGRRAVGRLDRLRRQALRHRSEGLHGQGQLQPETLPAADDEHLGRRVSGLPVDHHRVGPSRPQTGSRRFGKPRAGNLRGRRDGTAQPRGYALLSGQRPEPRAAAPDRHRAGGRHADGDGRRRTRPRSCARTSPKAKRSA